MTAPSSVLSQLAKVVHLMRTVPDDVEVQRHAFLDLVHDIEGQDLVVGTDLAGISVGGISLPQGAPFADELRGQLEAHGVEQFTLPADLPSASLMIFLRTLAKPRGEIRNARAFAELLDEKSARLISIRGPRAMPAADQLVTLEPDPAADATAFNVPSTPEITLPGSTRPVWQEESHGKDLLREAQVDADKAVREQDWKAVLAILAYIVDQEAATEDPSQRRRYGRALGSMAPRSTIKKLASLSRHGHRQQVATVLRRIGADATATLLELMASAEDLPERREYFTLLAQMEDGTDAIVNRLSDENWFVVRNVAELCADMDLADAVPRLAGQMDHPDIRVRRAVAGALAKIGTPVAAEPLRRALHDSEPTVRLQAAQFLDGKKARGLGMTLAVLLDEEEHPDVRRELHLALGRIGTPEAIQALVRSSKPGKGLFGRKPVEIRLAAVDGLALAEDPRAREALKELTTDKDARVGQAARKVLSALKPVP